MVDALPRRLAEQAKAALAAIYTAPTRTVALDAAARFGDAFAAHLKAVAKVTDDLDALLAFYDFPAEHAIHLRTTNPIELTFSAARPRTRVTKGVGSRAADRTSSTGFDHSSAVILSARQCLLAEDRWRRLRNDMRSATLAFAAVLVLFSPMGTQADQITPSAPGAVRSPAVVRQTQAEAAAQDLGLIADAHGWTLDQAAANQHAADVIGDIAQRVAKERPEIYIGASLSEEPGGPPTLYVKGPATTDIVAWIEDAYISIVLKDGQPYSFEELEARKRRVHQLLVGLGFRTVGTSVNITGGGVIPAGVAREPGLPATSSDILARLPDDVRGSVELTVVEKSAAVGDFFSEGGVRVKDTQGGFICTSGWTVMKISTGLFGVSSAGHCTSMDTEVHPVDGNIALTFSLSIAGNGAMLSGMRLGATGTWMTSMQARR